MGIYVDQLFKAMPRTAQARQFGTRWCHLTCDGNLEELHQFAERLGLRRSYFQDHRLLPHYDLVPSKRAMAVQLGAIETTTEERMQWALQKRQQQEQTVREMAEISQEPGLYD